MFGKPLRFSMITRLPTKTLACVLDVKVLGKNVVVTDGLEHLM